MRACAPSKWSLNVDTAEEHSFGFVLSRSCLYDEKERERRKNKGSLAVATDVQMINRHYNYTRAYASVYVSFVSKGVLSACDNIAADERERPTSIGISGHFWHEEILQTPVATAAANQVLETGTK